MTIPDIKHHLIDAMKARIMAENWTQTDAAEAMGLTQPRISSLVNYEIHCFTIDKLVDFCGRLRITVEVQVK